MKIYAIEVSYGDGYTYSAEKLDLFHTDRKYLQDLCDTFTILNEDKDRTYYVVEISVASEKFSDAKVNQFKYYWDLKEE